MDITSPKLLKLKGALFLLTGVLSGGLLLYLTQPSFSWEITVLLAVCIWAFCRAYYFCFYVMRNYVDPAFKYAGILDLLLHLTGIKRNSSAP